MKHSFRVALAALAASAALSTPTISQAQNQNIRVIGQPLAIGLIQKDIEQPFFEDFKANTGLDFGIDYKPMDTLGIKDTEQLRVIKSGLFDIVSLRMSQNSRDEPMLLGLDLVGAEPDYETARKVTDAYFPTIDEELQKRFKVKLLGVWPFGPQILFCKKPIQKLADVKGLKVRVYDQNLAKFIEMIGGTPVTIPFAETHQALSLGVVDCAVTGPSSANLASWTEVTTHQLPIGFQISQNGYIIRLDIWNRLNSDDQNKLQSAFKKLTDRIWEFSEELYRDGLNCNTGIEPCKYVKKFNLTNVPVTPEDIQLLREAVSKVSFPAWASICDKSSAGCSETWMKEVGKPVLDLQ